MAMPSSEPTKREIAESIQHMLWENVGSVPAGATWALLLEKGNKDPLSDVRRGIKKMVDKLNKAEAKIAELKASITK